MQKIFVDVEVTFDKDGYMHPRSITWTDGAVYEITRILDVRRSASLKAGGQGIPGARYPGCDRKGRCG